MNKPYPDLPISAVDLFCGAGGLTHGLILGGIDVKVGIDIDPDSQYPYEYNNKAKFVLKDVRDMCSNEISSFWGNSKFRMLAGCAPCQPFSTYSRGCHVKSNSKWELLAEFKRLIKEVEPDFVTMENVPQLMDHSIFDAFVKELNNYHVWSGIVEGPKFGIPQRRKRLVLIASSLGPIELIEPTHKENNYTTVRNVIGKLPHLEAGESCSTDPLHTSSRLSNINLLRIKQSSPGGTWRDWDDELIAKCHQRTSGKTYPSVYGRMIWDEPAPTITTQFFGYGNGRFGHPEQNRAISLREAAIFQTFPVDYQFVPPGVKPKFNVVGRLIGNAVPVRLGEIIAHSFRNHLSKQKII